ncbi:MAG: type I DNA topoisomerase [Saprospiraceae bacterium]
MPKNLLIVESPAKAKTIEKYLGEDFKVKSSFGHVRDLDKTNNAVDVDNDFDLKYIVSPEKKKVVKELKDWVKKVDEVWLATDEDREGEAISWHLCKVLGLDEHTTKRIVFREITKPAIQKAILKPRTVDLNLVDAQQARRVLDRLVGFELSGILWKKVKGKLSAGRVQSVAVKLLVERERQIMEFEAKPFYRINAIFSVKNEAGKLVELKAELPTRYDTEQEAQTFLNKSVGATFKINDIEVKPLKRKPTAPFTTSTLQQDASRKLGFAVKRTMSVAQRLYEQGFITYMRTDSVSLSETALQAIATEIEDSYGQEYLQTRRFKTKKKDAQEAHEAIRPTYIQRKNVSGDRDEQRLYELIWKRTIASQMAEAKLEKTTVRIGNSNIPAATLNAVGEVLKFDGFLKVYLEGKDDDGEEGEAKGILPPLKIGQVLDLDNMTAVERFTRPPARFTEAALVKKLEELGIGRPSTYAPTISKIMEEGRGYVVKEEREGVERKYNFLTLKNNKVAKEVRTETTGAVKNRLIPTDLGMIVSDFLSKHFEGVMSYGFTADLEEQFDEVAGGKIDWRKLLKDFYIPFHTTVEDTLENADRATGERILGKDPETGRNLLVRMSRYGPVVQIGSPEELGEEEKPRYANLKRGQSMETVTFEEALEAFKLPRTLGDYEDLEVSIGAGRFGPYVKHNNKFISIPRDEDPLEMTFERAIELIKIKQKEDAPIDIYQEHEVTQGKGRFGPFLKWNGMFINIPRRFDPDNLTKEEMHELIDAKVEKEAKRYIQRWDDLKLSVQNARWGPLIKWNKKNISIPKIDGNRITPEAAAEMTLEEVKELVEEKFPDAFKKKTRAKKKPAAKKKTAAKKK